MRCRSCALKAGPCFAVDSHVFDAELKTNGHVHVVIELAIFVSEVERGFAVSR